MISLFDADAPFADDSAMGYQRYTTDFKLACLKRYFTPPMKPVRELSAELGVPFTTLAEWVTKARKAGMLNPGEAVPAMVEVRPAETPVTAEAAIAPATPDDAATVTISIGKATVTMPSSLLPQALEALLRQ